MDVLRQFINVDNFTQGQMEDIVNYFKQKLTPDRTNNELIQYSSEQSRKREIKKAEDKILKQMLNITAKCGIKGYMFGIVDEKGNACMASSESLREWAQETVKFNRNAPFEIEKHNFKLNRMLMSKQLKEVGPKSLMELQDPTLGSILSLLMKNCNPPRRRFKLEDGVPPPWWPKGTEDWWIQAGFGLSDDGMTVPYKKPHNLRKSFKAGVIASIVKYMMPESRLVCALICNAKRMQFKMTARDNMIWVAFVEKEEDHFWNNGHNTPDIIAEPSTAFQLESESVDCGMNFIDNCMSGVNEFGFGFGFN